MNEQHELPLRRTRARLDDEDRAFGQPHRGHDLEEEVVELRVRLPRKAAAAVAAADPEELALHLAVQARQAWDALCTGWFTARHPECSGIWEVTDHATGELREFWWFSDSIAPVWSTGIPGSRAFGDRILGHNEFAKKYSWRGLRECPNVPYPCPPYRPEGLMSPRRVRRALERKRLTD